jgi:hypothetical protein
MDYEIVTYTEEFKDQVLKLQRERWGPSEKLAAAVFEWKYEQNPYLDHPLLYLALHGTEVIGMRALFGAKWQLGSTAQEMIAPSCADTMVFPAHRAHGVFGKITRFMLADLAERGYPCAPNLSAQPATHIQSLMMGWRYVGAFERLARAAPQPSKLERIRRYVPQRPKLAAVVRQVVNSVRRHVVAKPALWTDSFRSVKTESGGQVSVERTAMPSEMAGLVARSSRDGRIRHVRDAQYFSWRYRNPKATYQFLFWRQHGILEGYMVLQVGGVLKQGPLFIVDWEAANDRVRRELFDVVLELGRSSELTTWTVSLPEEAKSMLRAAAFKPVDTAENLARTGPGFLVRILDRSHPIADPASSTLSLMDIRSWDLRMIDSETR